MSERSIRLIDRLIFITSVIGPLSMLPEIIAVIKADSVDSHSILTWLAWFGMAVLWMVWGIAHKQRAVVFAQAAWVLFEGVLVVCLLVHQ